MVTMGDKCLRFEKDFSDAMNVPESVFVNSGSSANLLALFAISNHAIDGMESRVGFSRLRAGQEVIVPALTWSTSVWPIVQAGAIPVLVDSDPETLQMQTSDVESAMSDLTGAVLAVHLLGNAAPVSEILKLTRSKRIPLIEDTCEALGTALNGKKVGTIGDIGTYSFFFSHHITTIEGGMTVTPHAELGELLRCLRAHGWTRHLKNRVAEEAKYPGIDPRFLFINMGFNLRPTEINAAFGIHQLKKLDGFNRKRKEIAGRWLENLAPLIRNRDLVPMQPTPQSDCTWFGFPVLVDSPSIRDRFRTHLESNGIETRPIVCGNLARQPAFQHFKHRIHGDLSGANRVMDCGIYWGSHPLMSDEEVEYVSKVVLGFFT